MGWCHEFGVQIRPDCGHPMQAAQDSCVCRECGTVCTGHFGGCPDVWSRGPIPVTMIPARPVSVPQVEDREPVLIVSTPQVDDDGPDDDPFFADEPLAHRAAEQPPARRDPDRDRLLAWLVTTFRDVQQEVHNLSDSVTRQQALLTDLSQARQAELRVAELAQNLPDRLGAAIAAAIEARQEGYIQRFDEVVNTIATQLASSLPKRLGTAIAEAVEERQEVMVRLVEQSSKQMQEHLGEILTEQLSKALPKRIGAEAAAAIEVREQALVQRLDELVDTLGGRLAESIAQQLGPALIAATEAGQRVIEAQVKNAAAQLQESVAALQSTAEDLRDAQLLTPSQAQDWGSSTPTVEQAVDRAVHSVLRRAGSFADSNHPSLTMAAVPAPAAASSLESFSAGELAEVNEAKAALRSKVWKAMTKAKTARFPGAEGRIPNFVGAEAAADLLQDLDEWTAAAVVKANPDAPQWPVRERALAGEKVLYMAVPRLAGDKPFYLLDGEELEETPRRASSIKGAARVAETVSLVQLDPIDIVVTGCVAVGRDGARLGKGGGYSDLEFALLSQAGVIGPDTLVVTTAHPLQVQDAGVVPTAPHDLWVDVIVTPDEVIRCARDGGRPDGFMRWDQLSDEQLAAIPVLRDLRPA